MQLKSIVLFALACGCLQCTQKPTLMTPSKGDTSVPSIELHGFLRSTSSFMIHPPSGRDWSYKILEIAPESSRVTKGDLVASFEGEEAQKRLRQTENDTLEQQVNAESKITQAQNDIDALVDEIADGEKDLDLLQTGVDDESIANEWLLSARDRLIAELDVKAKILNLRLAREKLARKRQLLKSIQESSAQETERSAVSIQAAKEAIESGKVLAPADGVVVYKLNWRREQPRIGGMAYRGADVLEIVDDHSLYVEAYLREVDWPRVKIGQNVIVNILGRREIQTQGVIKKISRIVMDVSDWERSLPEGHALFEIRAFRVKIDLEEIPSAAKPDGEVIIEIPLHQETSQQKDNHGRRMGA